LASRSILGTRFVHISIHIRFFHLQSTAAGEMDTKRHADLSCTLAILKSLDGKLVTIGNDVRKCRVLVHEHQLTADQSTLVDCFAVDRLDDKYEQSSSTRK